MKYKKIRAIISGGGTGGHIFPAVSIAKELKKVNPDNEILFVGAEGKMEMEKVPAEGFEIVGLPITGLQRQLTFRNLMNDILVPFRFIASIIKARRIIRKFRPDIAVGVGGYASAPLLRAATAMRIPALIQEQNGFAGLTNKLLGPRVQKICVAYEGMERFFPAEKIVMSGNPIRPTMHPYTQAERLEGLSYYGFDPAKRRILIIGGPFRSTALSASLFRPSLRDQAFGRKSSRIGVKISSRTPSSRQHVPWGSPEGTTMESPGPSTVSSPSTL